MKIKKYDLILLIISIFLQNFALIKSNSFGIAFSSVLLIYLFFKYKIYKSLNNFVFLCILILLFFLITNSGINDNHNIKQILRFLMIIFDSFVSYNFIKILNSDDKKYFLKIFNSIFILWCLYGLYDYLAQIYGLPQFLNIFSNNPSYGSRGIFQSYSGWSNSSRIYTTFFEPSVYSLFLVYSYFFLRYFYDGKNNKVLLFILFLINLILTFARTGYLCFLFFIIVIFGEKILKMINSKILIKLYRFLIILIPVISFVFMLIINNNLFKDDSMNVRTTSSVYYLSQSFDSTKNIVIGHGIGTLTGGTDNKFYKGQTVEDFAHNGYIEFIYQFGFILFILVICFLVNLIEKIKSNKKIIIYTSIFTVCISGAIYNVESIIIILSIMCSFALNQDRGDLID